MSLASTKFFPIIGLELHVQLSSRLKLFSLSPSPYASPSAPPNTSISYYDAALPGTLPVLNREPVKLGILAALVLGCEVKEKSGWDRKHYFYHDQPNGYQITQCYHPIATNGKLNLAPPFDSVASPTSVRIERIQLEQDTSKSIRSHSTSETLLDLNRTGSALIEIVTAPDLRSSSSAVAFVKKLQSILRICKISDGNMESGSLRCDANVSLSSQDGSPLGGRCEIKNIMGLQSLAAAIEFEINRQGSLLDSGNPVPKETRAFDQKSFTTYSMRSKESSPDYRFMPDPDLPILRISPTSVDALKAKVPELPEETFVRLKESYGLSERDAGILVNLNSERIGEDGTEEVEYSVGAKWFEDVMRSLKDRGEDDGKRVGNLIINDLLKGLNKSNLSISESPIKPQELAELVDCIKQNRCNTKQARNLISQALTSPFPSLTELLSTLPPPQLAGLGTTQLLAICQKVVKEEEEAVRQIINGKESMMGKLIGRVLKESDNADGKTVREMLERVIAEMKERSDVVV